MKPRNRRTFQLIFFISLILVLAAFPGLQLPDSIYSVFLLSMLASGSILAYFSNPRKSKDIKLIASLLFLLSFTGIAAGLYIECIPLFVYYVGYAGLLISGAFFVGIYTGIGGLTCLFFALFFALIAGIAPIIIVEKNYPDRTPKITENNDLLKSKHPPYISTLIEKRSDPRRNNSTYYVNRTASVIGIDLSDTTNREKKISSHVYPTLNIAIEASEKFDCDLLPSVDLIDAYKKHLDDRFQAALDQHISNGSSLFPGGKQGFLTAILKEVKKQPDSNDASSYLAAAIRLGGGTPDVSLGTTAKSQNWIFKFHNNSQYSRPIGFYSESPNLSHIFQRDRFLQTQFTGRDNLRPLIQIAKVLADHPDLLQAYRRFSALNAKICNPASISSLNVLLSHRESLSNEVELRDIALNENWKLAFLPSATSKEAQLFARIYTSGELPRSDVMYDLIRGIRSGKVSLSPEPSSGYYDYQLYALESLVLTDRTQEAQKLLLHSRYKNRLREAFEAMLTKRRETNIKELPHFCTVGDHMNPLPQTPELSIEPCATNYLRTARAYKFLENALRNSFSEKELTEIKVQGEPENLPKELDDAIALFYGLYLTVCNDIGMVPKLEPGELTNLRISKLNLKPADVPDECLAARVAGLNGEERNIRVVLCRHAADWLKHIRDQKFLDEDQRVIIPVVSNAKQTKMRYWAVIGIRLLKIKAYYAVPPKLAEGYDITQEDALRRFREGLRSARYEWKPRDYVIPVQVFTELTLSSKPPTREEYRSTCNRWHTKEDIINTLNKSFRPSYLPIIYFVSIAAAVGILIGIIHCRRSNKTGCVQ